MRLLFKEQMNRDEKFGNYLKVFLLDAIAQNYPERWVGVLPDTSQPMNNNLQKAAIA
jgi:hypothetical protein